MRKLTVARLREALEDYADDAEILAMHQEGYPLVETLGGIYQPSSIVDCEECELPADDASHHGVGPDAHDFTPPHNDINRAAVYLVLTGHPTDGSPYGDRLAWDAMDRIR